MIGLLEGERGMLGEAKRLGTTISASTNMDW